ncbi:hypothetical protein ACHAQD_008041 [Fusarium lateritium]
MPPYAAELETWWSGSGLEALTHLVNDDTDELNPRQCGFAQQLQTRLLTFDNDRTIHTQIQKAWPAIRAARGVDYDANTRKYAKYIASTIFRKPDNGGIDFDRVMDGLGYLDAMEIRRLRLLAATRKTMETGTPSEASAQVIEELDRTATANFRHLHAGFRTCVLVEELNKDAEQRKEVPQIMALLNALVPPVVFLEDEDDVDPSPHSPGLRDSVRFSIFQHLMSEDSFSPNRREIIEMKLRCWCDVPGYPRARDALLRYTEEFKKLENVCLKVMNELERISMTTVSYQTISADSSALSGADASHHSSLLANSLQGENTILTPNTSVDNQQFTSTTPTTPWVPVAFHPLLRGMPGREISPAITDGAMFARDFSAPPVLSYPDNLSKTEFFQHPFARKLDMTFYDPDTDDEAREDVPPVPPLPHIPERLKAHLTPSVLNKIKKKMRYQSHKTDDPTLDGVPFQALDQYMGASTTRKLKDRKPRPMINANVSEASVLTGAGHQRLHSEDSGFEIPSISSSLPKSAKWPPRPIQIDREPGTILTRPGTGHGPKLECQLMEPRLSPMEYCRMYLVEKALSERENRQCELPKPEQKRYWTQYHKKFLIIPRIPKNIRRDLVPRAIGPITSLNVADSDGESVSTLTPEVDYNGLMRLSLHLENDPVLLPCFTDIPRPNVRESKILEPPDTEEEIRDDRNAEVSGGGDVVLSHRVKGPAGGEVDDWRPMSEYEHDEHNRMMNDDMSLDKGKATTTIRASDKIDGTEEATIQPITSDTPQSPEESEPGSQTPCKRVGAEAPPGDLVRSVGQSDDFGNLSLSRKLSRVCTKDLSVLDFATPRSKGKNVTNTTISSTTIQGRSPLARFPIAVQPTHRLTPGTLTKRVIGESGGQFLSEDTRQARLIPSPSSQLHQGLTADLWDTDTESIISELQPEPLNISRRRPRANTNDDRRWSRMFDGLSSNVSPTLGKFGTSCPVEREGGSRAEVDDDNCTSTEEDCTPRGLGHQLQSHARTTPGSGGLQRSASTIITPTQPIRRLQPKASFNLENTEHSGFTPKHVKEGFSKGTFPTSGTMLNLQDTQTRLRYPHREPDEMLLSRSLDDATPRARRLPDIPDSGQHQQNFTPRNWMRSVTTTPRRANIMSRYERSISSADSTTASFQTSSIMNEGDVQFYPSTAMRDFTQSHQLDKQRPKAKLTPSSTHRFSKQRFDHSTRASSPPLSADRPDIVMRRTPSPTELHNTAVPQTPSSGIGGLFRKRIRSEYHPPATPRTPASPRLAWRPFDDDDDDEPELPYLSPWASGHTEGKRGKERRAAYFREKVEREIQGRQSLKRPARRESFSTVDRDCTSRNGSVLENRMSRESLVAWTNFIEDAPEPLFSSPLPPVPPLPSESQLNLTLKQLPQNRTPSRTVSGFEPSPAGTFRAKKPQGLKVDTQRLRKANRDGARTPSRSATMTPASVSSFRTAFRIEERQMGFGREAPEESQSTERDDEVVSRRK